ncbi:MAG: DUF1330 domain-containing protein [Saccharospirillaceae bacterium]|nr:DUF1330 domain-containing protein [Pseudomonadales bacterium]NRB81235.1 DUF1330 domain-containing protein [Saccharospirillaceae bacterium]
MTFQRIMGIEVSDNNQYDIYREQMEPLLLKAGGAFGYDFKIEQVLRSKTNNPINRVFTIEFPSQQIMDVFFTSDEYIVIRDNHFDKSVSSKTVIALFATDD